MSEENSPGSNEPENKKNPVVTLALLAGVLGLVIAAGLYAFSGVAGNVENSVASTGADSASCSYDKALAQKLDAGATGHVAAFKATDKAFSVADFAFKDKDGNDKTFADWKGRTVLFNLWATWCAPCRAEMPALDALQKDLGGDAFEVVPVSVDLGDPSKPKKFYQDIGLKNLGLYHDEALNSLNTLKKNGLAYGLPATLLIDKNSCVVGVLNGPAEWATDEAKELIKIAF